MSSFISFIGGLSCKLYDDLDDNSLLHQFKNNILMEYLKGIHYMSITVLSIDDPLFFCIFYLANYMNYLTNNEAFSKDYEYSLSYSFALLFSIIDYNKIVKNSIFDYLLLFCFCFTMYFEVPVMKYFLQDCEFSYVKLIIRILLLIIVFFMYLLGTSKTVKYIFSYFIGYFGISVLVQYYSLIKNKDENKEDIKHEKEKEGEMIKDNKKEEDQPIIDKKKEIKDEKKEGDTVKDDSNK